jgi:hypothetical protein
LSILYGNTYEAKDLLQIAENYEDYVPDENKINQVYWARNWEGIIIAKADFDTALKSLSPRKRRFIELIIELKEKENEVIKRELEIRGYWDVEKFKWAILNEMARTLNGR